MFHNCKIRRKTFFLPFQFRSFPTEQFMLYYASILRHRTSQWRQLPQRGEKRGMKPHVSSYERGRNIVRVLVVLAIILGVTALMFTHDNSREQMILVIASASCVVGVIVVARLLCVCPHCGKRIVSGVLVLRICPKCKHDLLTGAKVKNKR